MISMGIISNAGNAANYYGNESKANEYYDGEAVPSEWMGKGAEAQGLDGPVNAEELKKQLNGNVIDISGERTLGVKRGGELQHRPGYDFTVSAPKSISLEGLVFDNKTVLDAHAKAVDSAFNYLEKNGAQTRIAGKTVQTGNLTASNYTHVASRAGDPQLHNHVVISNVTFDSSGKAYSLSNERLFEFRRSADAVYHSELGRELQKAGYKVKFDSEGRVELADYDQEKLDQFSQRREEIKEELKKQGKDINKTDAKDREHAAKDTRSNKTRPESRAEYEKEWQKRANDMGLKPATQHPIESAKAIWNNPRVNAHNAVDKAVEHLSERESVWRDKDLYQQSARFNNGGADWTQIEKEIEKRVRSGDLIRDPETGRLTNKESMQTEQKINDKLEAGRGDHMQILTPREFDRALQKFEKKQGFKLSPEQRDSAKRILTGRDTYQGVQGLAGTGKTTELNFVREAAEEAGWKVIGHSNGAAQAATMKKESGIQSTTTDRYLGQVARVVPVKGLQKTLNIMDEASMAGTKNFSRVLDATEKLGGKTVFLGDKYQHQSVTAGRAFERSQSHMQTSRLGVDSVRRQRTESTKNVANQVFEGRHSEAVRSVPAIEIRPAQDTLPPEATRSERRDAARQDNQKVMDRLADDYSRLPPAAQNNTLVVTATVADRDSLNTSIRDRLVSQGRVEPGARIDTLRPAGNTKIEARRVESYSPGQVVEIAKTDKVNGLQKGDRYEVKSVEGPVVHAAPMGKNGPEKLIDPAVTDLRGYDVRQANFGCGDRIRITENKQFSTPRLERDGLKNGETGVVTYADTDRVTIRLDRDGEVVTMDTDAGVKLDHAYVSTSYSAQGRTVDQVMVHHNVASGAHGQRENYVNFTRARDEIKIYTQNAEKAAAQADVKIDKTAAHDIAPPPQEQTAAPEPATAPPETHPEPPDRATRDEGPERD